MNINSLIKTDWDFAGEKTNSFTHSMHPYPAKYIPQIPRAIIQELSDRGDLVADIFCGSGTTLVEANLLGRNALGIDANPLACLISEAKTIRLQVEDEAELAKLIDKANKLAAQVSICSLPLISTIPYKSQASRPADDAIEFWFEPFVIEELAEILSMCRQLPTETSQKIALVAFSSIVVSVSKQDSDTRYVRRDKKIKAGETFRHFAYSLARSVASVKEFTSIAPPNTTSKVYFTDILAAPDIEPMDLLVCSPPFSLDCLLAPVSIFPEIPPPAL